MKILQIIWHFVMIFLNGRCQNHLFQKKKTSILDQLVFLILIDCQHLLCTTKASVNLICFNHIVRNINGFFCKQAVSLAVVLPLEKPLVLGSNPGFAQKKKEPSSAFPCSTRNHCGCLQWNVWGQYALSTLWRIQATGLWGLFSTGQGRASS